MQTPPGSESVRELDAARDRDAVAALWVACEDYAMLVSGEPPRRAEGEGFLAAAPPDRALVTMLKLGLFRADGRLAGIADVARDYPEPGTWHVGLVLVHPASRGRGLGRALVQRIEDAAADARAARLRLLVLEENERALDFWRGLGFAATARLAPIPFGSREHARIELTRAVARAP